MPHRRDFLALTLALLPSALLAHHGWRWASDAEFSLSGVIVEARLGNPHGVLTVDAADGRWRIEVGQPWRNAEAGLSDDMLAPGAEITAEGHRSADPEERLMKAERILIGGELHNLYPDRS